MDHDQFVTDFSVSGATLDVDRLLALASSPSNYTVVRRGDLTEFGEAHQSHIQLCVFSGGSRASLEQAIEEFLRREARMLDALGRDATEDVAVELDTTMFVRSKTVPVGVRLSADLLQKIGAAGVKWSVLGVPCDEDGKICCS